MFSIRIVNSDFYTAIPIPNLDVCSSAFRETKSDRVPVIRIYGATPSGQKTCLHVHGVFPYIYVPYDGTQPVDKYLKQFAVSVDFAVQVALGKASSSRQHVYEIGVVKGIPFYGYHEGEREFLKISLYNPFLVTRVVSLLQNGAVMNKVFQPHEAHIPYLLQFFMDYNLHGMNLLHALTVKFRNPVRLVNGVTGAVTATHTSESPQISPKDSTGTPSKIWNEDSVPREYILGSDVERLSFCELEVDVMASDILNKLEIGVNIGTNPGLAAIWEDEQQRRRDAKESSQISAPSSQDRRLIQETEVERQFKERIKEIINERDLLIQSQIEKLGQEALSPQELSSFQDSICSLAASQREPIAKESLDAEAVSQLLSQHVQGMLGEGSAAEFSQMVIDEDEPVVNQSIVQEVVEASPSSFSQDLTSSMDKQMIDILASLADEPTQSGSQRVALSQSIVLDQGDAPCDEEVKDDEQLSEDEESIMMSQRVWDDIDQHAPGSGDEQATGEQDSHVASQRASQYDLEGMSDTWFGSFLGGDIPQLDGAADDTTEGQEDFILPRRRRARGQARKRPNQLEGAASETLENSTESAISSTRPRSTERTITEMASKGGAVVGKVEESSGEDVWPLKAKAIRTYSKKGKSAPRTKMSPALNTDNVEKNDGDKVIEVLKDPKEEESAFRLFLSESSDSEDGNSGGVNLGSAENKVMANRENETHEVEKIRKTKIPTAQKDDSVMDFNLRLEGREFISSQKTIKLEARKRIDVKSLTTRKDQNRKAYLAPGKRRVEASHENPKTSKKRNGILKKKPDTPEKCTPVITKYFPSPSKNSESITTRQNATKLLSSSRERPSTSDKTDDAESTSRTAPHCSTELERTFRKNTWLHKRKLSVAGKKDQKLSHEKTLQTKQTTDSAASLKAVSGAMSCLTVSLEDICQISTQDSKIIDAQTRLKTRGGAPCQSFTRLVDQKLNSPVRKETPAQKLRSKRKERSPLSKKRTSPKRKEEITKKYGTLPVLIATSPKKSLADSSQLSEASVASQLSQVDGVALRSQMVVSDLRSSCGTGHTETEYSSSRSQTRSRASSNRQTGLVASGTKSGAYALSNEEMTRKGTGLIPSRLVPLKSAGGIEEKSRSEAGGTLSHSRRGLKRKLVVDIDKDLQLTPVGVLPGSVKKRKLSLKLKSNSSRSSPRKESVDENLVTTSKESLLDQSKSVEEVNDTGTKPGVNISNNGRRLALDSKIEFVLSRDLLDGITCIPSSPGEPDSSNESLMITKSNSLLDLTNEPSASTKSQETSNVSCPTESKYETTDNVISDLNCLEEQDTELLANALFNMSFPSPLPCGEECHSPPHPSTPLKTNCNMLGVTDQEKSLIEDKEPTLGSIVVEEEDDDVSAVIKAGSSPIAPSQKQVQRIAYFSPANTRVPAGSPLLPLCPQLGETQTQLENIPGEGHDSFAQKLRNKEVTGDKGSFDPRKILMNKSISRTNEELLISQANITEKNKGFIFNSELAIYEDKSSASKSVHESEVNESSADISDRKLVKVEVSDSKSIDETDFGEVMKSRSSIYDSSGFVLRLSTEEESLTRVHSSVHSEIEISQKEDKDDPPQEGSTEGVCIGIVAVEPVINQEDQSLSTQDRPGRKFTSGHGTVDVVAIKPLRQPPTSDELISSLRDYGLPRCKYQQPFCSNPDDIPAYPREVGGRLLKIESKAVSSLPEFESLSSSQGLKHWRTVMSSAQECGIRSICPAMDDVSNLHKNVELKIALMGDGEIVVTPCRGPPAPEAVKAWARSKLTKHNGKAQKPSVPKTVEQIKKPPEVENLKDPTRDQDSEKKTMAANSSATEWKKVIPSPSGTVMPPIEVTQEPSVTSSVTTMELLANKQQKELGDAKSTKKCDVMELSDSSSPMEVTSPCSLFSPNEAKIFTFASGTQTKVSRTKPVQSEILGTQPMRFESRDVLTEPKEVGVTSGTSFLTVTPFKGTSPEQTLSTAKQPLSPLPQAQSPVFPVPYHSTPVATKLVYGAQSPRCTPISNTATKVQRLDTNVQVSAKRDTGAQTSSDQAPSLRQQLLASQFKFVTPGAQARRSIPWSSQIEGPSPNNTYGFKVTQVNLQNAKALHEVQHLTLLSLELHARTRREARPDPEFDPICAIFYYVQTDTPLPNGKNKVTGVICVDPDSAKISTSATGNKENCLHNIESSARQSPYKEAVASTSTSNVTRLKTLQNTSAGFSRPLLCRTGVTEYDVQYVTEEKDIFLALLDVVHKWDPDIFIGYEVQMFSWGYLLERALTFEIDLCTRLSRVKGSSSSSNMDAEKDRWGAAHTSEIKIAGRIILNVWRLMRHEVTLNSYSFENVAFHALHERIPLFTFRTLSDWWDHRTSLNRWRTVDHYVTRCRGNVRILESVDFIGRTSELARLFGILFYSVISRGSQYRVESMMLRIAKPMNYIPVSPSVEQRGAMRAPETIPLVMEPESRFYSDPVLVLDFQSLYPSMVIAYNYCFSTCLGRVSCLSEYGEFKFGATSLCVPPSLLKKLEGDIHISPNGVAFVKPSVRKGILPSMLDEILQTRIMVKTSMKRWKADKSLGRMLDARQLGLKLIANVTFGYTSAHFSGRMPCVEIGDSIVRKARETLERAIDLVNNTPRWGARVVYGDTDSLFVLLKGVTKEQAFSIGKDIVDTVTAMNPKPVKLKFEKVYLPCVLQTKKRYVGYMYETLDQKEPVFDAKGIETVRRDSCPAVAKILEKSLRFLFETRDLTLVKKYVQRQCSKLMEGRASLQDFTFAKEYRGMKNYKPGACVPALELTRRMLREDRRSEPRVGERVPYVVVYGSPGLPLIQLVRRPHEVLQDPNLRLNASYYITKQILPPLNRVFLLIGLDVFTWYAELPRIVRVAQMPTDAGNRKKGTISQYFSTMTCPVCQELTPTDLCSKCRATPQVSAVTLMNRMRSWERTHQHLAEICYGCCGSRDSKLCCVSLDCPVFYKLVQCTRDIKSSQHLRSILENL